jgi:hypothetical protein
LYHILIDGGAALNFISLVTFQKLQILMSKLAPSCLFLRVGLGSIIPCGSISLPVTLRTHENYRTESIVFDVAEVNLPFNAILGRPILYQFMVVTHCGYLVLKMLLPDGIIKIRRDRTPDTFVLEKLHTSAVVHEATAGFGKQDQAPSTSRKHVSSSAPHVQPSNGEDIPVKVIQISVDAVQITRITENLDDK